MKTYHQIRRDRIYGEMLHTHRCKRRHWAVVEAEHDNSVLLDSGHRDGNTALVHVCPSAKKEKNPKRGDLWD